MQVRSSGIKIESEHDSELRIGGFVIGECFITVEMPDKTISTPQLS